MLKRIKDAILPSRRETKERERLLQERAKCVQAWLYPVFCNWDLTCDILIWKTPVLSTTMFFLISGTFWAFLPPSYQRFAIAVGITLLFLSFQKELRGHIWDLLENSLKLKIREENNYDLGKDCFHLLLVHVFAVWIKVMMYTVLIDILFLQINTTPEEISKFLALACTYGEDHVVYVRELRHKSSSKFYCLIAVYLFAVLATWSFVPIIRLLYILCCCCFFFPGMRYYGIIDKLKQKITKLTEPVATHWEYNLTKRQRKKIVEEVCDSETDDEFALEKNTYTAQILSAVVKNDFSGSEKDLASSAHDSLGGFDIPSSSTLNYHDDFTDDEEFRPSEFEHGLEMPSLSQFDSIMEPYDEFHYGLSFPDHDHSLSHGFTPQPQERPSNGDLTDDDVDELPLEENVDGVGGSQHPESAQGLRHRQVTRDQKDITRTGTDVSQRDYSATGPRRDSPGGMERDYEFLDHSELDDVGSVTHSQQQNKGGQYLGKVVSYSQASLSQVSKWLGY